ncbi:MAG: hypothetical protein EXR99_16195 [Gemmataceae bacterium]|nr:hypothetical protein [Gemmataceae bacterium]
MQSVLLSLTLAALGFQPLEAKTPSFQLKVLRFAAIRDFTSDSSYSKLSLEIRWAKNLAPLFLDNNLRISSLKVAGKDLVFQFPAASVLVPVDEKTSSILDIQLPTLEKTVGKSLALEGMVRAIVPRGKEEIDFGDLADVLATGKSIDRQKNGLQCSLLEVKQSAGRLTFRLAVRIPPGGPTLDTSQNWVVLNSLYLVQNAKPRLHDGYLLESLDENQAILSYHFLFKDGKAPALGRLSYSAITGLKVLEEPFKIPAIPVP